MPRRLEGDRWLFGVTVVLCLFGAVMILSASAVTAEHQYGHSSIFLLRQAAWLVIGLLGMFVLMRTDYRKLREPAVVYPVVCIVLLLLVGTLFLDKSHATHRWIKFGPVGVQPSELAKLAVILYLAWFLDLRRRSKAGMEFCKEDFLQTILPAAGPVLICVVLILLQPDLGTSVEIVLFSTAILYVAGLSWKWITAGALAAVPILYLLITQVSYRQARLMAFLDPASDPQGAGFQLLQSLIAVGSGGFTGVGLMESKQKLFYRAWLYRRDDCDFSFCRLWLARHARGVCCARRVWALAGVGHHGHGAEPGVDQFRGGAWHGANKGNSAPIHQLWRIQFACHAAGHRSASEYFAASGGSVRSGRAQ